MESEKLNKAIEWIKSGNKQEAELILTEIVEKDPNIELGWLWLSACRKDPQEKIYCLEQATRINPNDKSALQALNDLKNKNDNFEVNKTAENTQQKKSNPARFSDFEKEGESLHSPSSSTTKGIEFIPAICPKCGGELRVPDNLKTAKCNYCGTDFIVETAMFDSEKQIQNYSDLAETAIKCHDYKEAYDFFNKILEIDSQNQNAWLGKGFACAMIALSEDFESQRKWAQHGSRLNEAWNYIKKGLMPNLPDENQIANDVFNDDFINLAKFNANQQIRLKAAKYCFKIGMSKPGDCKEWDYQSNSDDEIVESIIYDLKQFNDEEYIRGHIKLFHGYAYSLIKEGEYFKIKTLPKELEINREIILQQIIASIIYLWKIHNERYHIYEQFHNDIKIRTKSSLGYYGLNTVPFTYYYLFPTEVKNNSLLEKLIQDYMELHFVPDLYEYERQTTRFFLEE